MSIQSAVTASTGWAPYQLPKLEYGYADLEPIIDAVTMRLHHDKHHQAYVDGINAALAKYPELCKFEIEQLLRHLCDAPIEIRETVQNQGGGHANHSLFWKLLTPRQGGGPSGDLLSSISSSFGSLDKFQQQFEEAGTKLFGSGWVFLAPNLADPWKLEIVALRNQDSVLSAGTLPLLACDVWEHAYYLKYHNRRASWLQNWWEVVNWDYVAERFQSALGFANTLKLL